MRWTDLSPEPGIVDALDHAGIRNESGNQNEKRAWSERFANGCAIAFADQFRKSDLKKKRVRPNTLAEGTEPLTPLGSDTKKRIDVTVSDPVLGLEIGASLKGLNFKDGSSGNFDKNLTGRLYELGDEVRLVHEHLPHAFMVGVFFLPLDSVSDKKEGNSSFANAVRKLRERTGRLDVALAGHAARCDASYVALYTTGVEAAGYPRGACRFLNVLSDPPRRGRPKIETTLSISQVVAQVVDAAMSSVNMKWEEPEEDD